MPERVTVAQLQYFVSAHRHGSLSAAAAAHYVAQPSISEQIRRLETTLGVRLFERDRAVHDEVVVREPHHRHHALDRDALDGRFHAPEVGRQPNEWAVRSHDPVRPRVRHDASVHTP